MRKKRSKIKTFHYLLKPIRDEELITTVCDAINELKLIHKYMDVENMIDENKFMLRSVFFTRVTAWEEIYR